MGKVTVEEPKTVVEEIERYECDHCSVIVDEEDITTVALFEGDISGTSKKVRQHDHDRRWLCEDCVGLREALEVREKKNFLEARWRGLQGWLDTSTAIGMFLIGVGLTAGGLLFAGVLGASHDMNAMVVTVDIVLGTLIFFLSAVILATGVDFVL